METIIHTGGIRPGMLSSEAKIKRAASEVLDATSAGDIAAIMHTTTAITVTAMKCYSGLACSGGGLKLDVGINGTPNSIAAAVLIDTTATDDVDAIAIGTAAVAAGETIVAKVNVVDAAAGEVQVLIEYTEND